MPRIAYITTGLARGGAEIQLRLLCERMLLHGWKATVLSLLPTVAFAGELRSLGVPVVELGLRKNVPDPRVFLRLVGALRAWKPDVVHCHQVHANLAGRMARLFAPTPVLVCTAHSIQEGPRWRDWAYRLTDPLCDLTTNVCRAGVERYTRVGATPAHKIEYLPNGIDLESVSYTHLTLPTNREV